VSWEKSKTTDKEYNGKLDFLKDYMLGNYAAALKFGGKISQKYSLLSSVVSKVLARGRWKVSSVIAKHRRKIQETQIKVRRL